MVTVIALVVVLGIVVGYAARQRQELQEAHDKVERLLLENEGLRIATRAHVSTIEMVLEEVERLS